MPLVPDSQAAACARAGAGGRRRGFRPITTPSITITIAVDASIPMLKRLVPIPADIPFGQKALVAQIVLPAGTKLTFLE